MRKRPETEEEVIQQARASRDQAVNTARKSSTLVRKTAQLEETIRQTEQQVKELKALVGASKRRRLNPKSRGGNT